MADATIVGRAVPVGPEVPRRSAVAHSDVTGATPTDTVAPLMGSLIKKRRKRMRKKKHKKLLKKTRWQRRQQGR